MGARPEIQEAPIHKQQPIPKEDWPILPNDELHPVAYTFDSEDDNIDSLIKVEHDPIKATDTFKPDFIRYNGTFDIQLRVGDYSGNCNTSHYFHFNESSITQPQIIDFAGDKIPACSL